MRMMRWVTALLLWAGPAAAAQPGNGPNSTLAAVNLTASGVSPVSGSFSGTGLSAAFTPIAGRPFNFAVWNAGNTAVGAATSCTVQLLRSIDGGTTYLPTTVSSNTIESITTNASESWEEYQTGVSYKLDCTAYSSGSATNYVFAQ